MVKMYGMSFRPALFLLLCVLASLPAFAVTLGITPAAIDTHYTSLVSLDIDGLAPGQSVTIERYVDVLGSGVFDTHDPLFQHIVVTDGQQPMIAGTRVPVMPGDEDGAANGHIHTSFSAANPHNLLQFSGNSFYRVTDAGGTLLASGTLPITQYNFGQTISGQVTAGAGGVAHAMVILFAAPGGTDLVASTVTDGSGNYSLQCPVGTFYLVAYTGGYLATTNWHQAPVTLTSGQTRTIPLTLTAATQHITGKVTDRVTGAGVAGVLLAASPEHGDQPISVLSGSDSAGNFDMFVTTGDWKIGVIEAISPSLTAQGYVSCANNVNVSMPGGSAVTIPVAAATAVITGTLKAAGTPLAGVDITAETNRYDTSAVTDANGYYVLPVIPGMWHVKANDADLQKAGAFAQQTADVLAVANQAAALNLPAAQSTVLLHGRIADNLNNNVAGIKVSLWGVDSAGRRCVSSTRTLADGTFDLRVAGGNWHIGVGSEDAANRGLFNALDLQVSAVDNVNQTILAYTLKQAGSHLRGTVTNGSTGVGHLKLVISDQNGTTFTERTAGDGNFDITVVGGTWKLVADANEAAKLLYFSPSLLSTVADNASQNGLSLVLSSATAHLRGTVADDATNPLAFLNYHLIDENSGRSYNMPIGYGTFDFPVMAGKWRVFVDANEAVAQELFDTPLSLTVADGVDQNGLQQVLQRATAHLTGVVKDAGGNPLEGAVIWATPSANLPYYNRAVRTDSTGSYRLGLINGAWSTTAYYVNDQVGSRINYPTYNTMITGGNAALNFVATPGYQSDLMIRNQGDITYLGAGIYPSETNQTKQQDAGANVAAVYQLQVQNLAAADDRFLITGPKSGTDWTVKYFDAPSGGNDITIQVTELGWSTEYLPANGTRQFRVEVTPSANVTVGTSFPVLVTAVSTTAQPATTDSVKAITIRSANHPPVASNGTLTVNAGAIATGTLSATDQDLNALTFQIVTNGKQGTAVITNAATGAFSYTANAGAAGTDTFTFKANDGQIDSNEAIITVTIPSAGYEGDVSPRPTGNGAVTIADWVQTGRFVAGLDAVSANGEFQRADCAPRATLGDGQITLADWVQAGRYAAGLDPLTPAGGPVQPTGSAAVAARAASGVKRPVQLSHPTLAPGSTGTVTVSVTAGGSENALGFTLAFDPARLRFMSARLVGKAIKATLNVNTLQAGKGSIALALALPPGTHFTAGQQAVVELTFQAAKTAAQGDVALTFSDGIIKRELTDTRANTMPALFQNGAVRITGKPRK